MNTLAKRWARVAATAWSETWCLPSHPTGWHWARIDKYPEGWALDVWELRAPGRSLNGHWSRVDIFPTLKEAKAVGRLVAGVALAKSNNF